MPRRSRINWPLLIGLAAFFGFLGTYIAWPLVVDFLGSVNSDTDGFAVPPTLSDLVRERATTAVTGLWFFVFGATIGSFLNVVAYRMPMGLSFVSKPSRCPYCETPILFKHNMPILGWFVLRGRCNACRLPISRRYVIVEILVGALFLTLFCAELASGGRNLPIRVPNPRQGVMWNLFTPQWDLIGLYAFHAFLMGVLTTIALIKFDKLKIPFRFAAFVVTVGIFGRVAWPHLGLLPPTDFTLAMPARVQQPIFDLVFGFVFGGIFQSIIVAASKRPFSPSGCGGGVVFGTVAVYLGWQATIPMLLIASFVQLLTTIVGRRRGSPTSRFWGFSSLVGAWLTICFWRQLPNVWLPGAQSEIGLQACGVMLGLASAWVAESLALQEALPLEWTVDADANADRIASDRSDRF
jgi:leader peptidase (prepilin peptidase)/N-methyltransferase